MSVTSGTKTESGVGETIRVVVHALLIALVILPATTRLSLGEGAPPAARLRRWVFLAMKLALLAPIVYFGAFGLGHFLSANGLQPQAIAPLHALGRVNSIGHSSRLVFGYRSP